MAGRYGEVVIHIGRHKSGTTSIQHELCLREEELASDGIVYSRCGRSEAGFANHSLALACQNLELEKLNRYRVELNDELKSARKLLISSEGFQNLKDIDVLFNMFPDGVRKQVVVYLRDVVDYLATSYAQRIQGSDLKLDFSEYALNRRINYREFVSKWASRCDLITVRFFHPHHLVNGDAVADFFSILGLSRDFESESRSRLNPSIGGNLLFAKLQLNRMQLAFNHSAAYNSLSAAALEVDRFKSGFWIDDALTKFLRRENSESYEYLKLMFGYEDQISFASKPFAPNTLTIREDLIYLSKYPGLNNLSRLQSVGSY